MISKVSATKRKETFREQGFSTAKTPHDNAPPTYHDLQGNFVKFGVPLTRLQAGKKPLFFHDHDGNAVKVEFMSPGTAREAEDEERFRLHERGEREYPKHDYDNVLPHLLEKEGPTYEHHSHAEQQYREQHEPYEPKHEEKQFSFRHRDDDGYKSFGDIHELDDREDRYVEREKSLGSATHSISGHMHSVGDGNSGHTAHSVLVPSFKIHGNAKTLPTSRSEVHLPETKVGKIVQVSTDVDTTVISSAASPEGKVKVSQHMSQSTKRTPEKRPPVATIINESRTHHFTIAEIKKKQKDLLLRQQNSEDIVKRTYPDRDATQGRPVFQRPVSSSYVVHKPSKRTRILSVVKQNYLVRPRVNTDHLFRRHLRRKTNAIPSIAIYAPYNHLVRPDPYFRRATYYKRDTLRGVQYPSATHKNHHSRKRSPEEWQRFSRRGTDQEGLVAPYVTSNQSKLNFRRDSPIKKKIYSMPLSIHRSAFGNVKVKKSIIAHRNDREREHDKVIARLDDDEESDDENDEVKQSSYLHDGNRIISRATIATKRLGEKPHVDDTKKSNTSQVNTSHMIDKNEPRLVQNDVETRPRSNTTSKSKTVVLGIMETLVKDIIAGTSNHTPSNDSLNLFSATYGNSTLPQSLHFTRTSGDNPENNTLISLFYNKQRTQTNQSVQVLSKNMTSSSGLSSRQYICSIVKKNNRTRDSFPLLPTVCNGADSSEQGQCLIKSNIELKSSNHDDDVERRCVPSASRSDALPDGLVSNGISFHANDSEVADTDDKLNVISGFVSNATDADNAAFLKEETYYLYKQVINGLRQHVPFHNSSRDNINQAVSRSMKKTESGSGTQGGGSKGPPIKLNNTVSVKARKLEHELSLLKHRRRRSLSHHKHEEFRGNNKSTGRRWRHHLRKRRNPNKFHTHLRQQKGEKAPLDNPAQNDKARKRTLPQAQRMELAGSVIRAALPAIAKALIQKALRRKQRNRFMQQDANPWPAQPPPVQQLPPQLTASPFLGPPPPPQQQFAAPLETTQYFHMPNRVVQPIQQFMPSVDETTAHGIFQQAPVVFTNQPASQQPVVYTNPMPIMASMPQVIPIQSAPVQTFPLPVQVLVRTKPKCPVAESCISCPKSRRDTISNNNNVLTTLLLHKLMNEKMNSDCAETGGPQTLSNGGSSIVARGGVGGGGGGGTNGADGGGIGAVGGRSISGGGSIGGVSSGGINVGGGGSIGGVSGGINGADGGIGAVSGRSINAGGGIGAVNGGGINSADGGGIAAVGARGINGGGGIGGTSGGSTNGGGSSAVSGVRGSIIGGVGVGRIGEGIGGGISGGGRIGNTGSGTRSINGMNIVPAEPPEELQLPPDPSQHKEEGLTKKFTKPDLIASITESNQVKQPTLVAITKLSPTVNQIKPTTEIKTTPKTTPASVLIKTQNSLLSNSDPTTKSTNPAIDRTNEKLNSLSKTVDVDKLKVDEKFNINGLKVMDKPKVDEKLDINGVKVTDKVKIDEKYASIGAKVVNRLNEDANIGVKVVEKLKEDANIGVKVVDKLKEDASIGGKVVDKLKEDEKYANIGVKVDQDRSDETNDEKLRTESAIQEQILRLTSSSPPKHPRQRHRPDTGRGSEGGEVSEFDVTGGGVAKRISNGLVVIPFGAFGYPKKEDSSKHEDEVATNHIKQYGMG